MKGQGHINKYESYFAGMFLGNIFFPPILLAAYYNFGKTGGGAVAMMFSGTFFSFTTLAMAAVIIDDRGNNENINWRKNVIVGIVFNILFCIGIVIAKRYAIAPGKLSVAMFAITAVVLVLGIRLIRPAEDGKKRG